MNLIKIEWRKCIKNCKYSDHFGAFGWEIARVLALSVRVIDSDQICVKSKNLFQTAKTHYKAAVRGYVADNCSNNDEVLLIKGLNALWVYEYQKFIY